MASSRSLRSCKMSLPSMQTGSRKIAIAIDLSPESAYAVRWAVENYLRHDDHIILLHVQPTSVLYGADWGAIPFAVETSDDESQQKLENDFDAMTSSKAADLAQPLVDAHIAYVIHILKDHDMKERICLEAERLGVNAVIMGSRGFGASKRVSKSRLGSVSDYCVHHCGCPVVVVRYPEECKEASTNNVASIDKIVEEEEEEGEDNNGLASPEKILEEEKNLGSAQAPGSSSPTSK